MTEWFRRTSWSPEDEREFFARLQRSRGDHNKSQYLRIQASHLEDTGDTRHIEAALKLLDLLVRDYPEPAEIACAFWQRARCHERLGQIDEAMAAYRQALEAEQQHPGWNTGAALDYAWLIATRRTRLLYDEALRLLHASEDSVIFPVHEFRNAAIRAMIAADRGDRVSAARFAQAALESAGQKESGFRYHKKAGLVGSTYQEVVDQLKRWAVG